ncbi:MAG: TerB family tellurite resistance protein [Campylobacterota bacterium]|nr:TerB family tellurite resistance protein [Campylobacterota bacterium]
MTSLIIYGIIFYILFRVYRGYKRFQKVYYSQKHFQNFKVTKESLHSSELGLFIALIAKVAKADGRVHELEAELINNMLNDIAKVFPQKDQAKAYLKEIFNEEKKRANNIDEVASALYIAIRNDQQKRHMMLMFLINLAFIDGHFSNQEERLILKIASFLHVSQNELDAMISRFSQMHSGATTQSSIEDAYKLLEIQEDASLDTIKKAYRKAVKKHHPDLMKAQGKDDAYIEEATQKVQEINAAYEMIKKVR